MFLEIKRMPFQEVLDNSYQCPYEGINHKRRKRRRSMEEREKRRSRSRSSHSTSSSKRHRHHGSPVRRRNREYRGSSGTRTSRRSYDRAVRLRQYYDKKQESEHHHHHQRSCRKGGHIDRLQEENISSAKSSPRSRSSSIHSKRSSSHSVRDDKDGHLLYREGDWLRNRYEVRTLLGEGTFGKCLECFDRKRSKIIALKVIKNIKKYREAAKLEIKVLEKLAKKDPENRNLCIELLGYFNYHGHICLLFPKLGKSVFDFMKENMYQPYTMPQVQHIAKQLLISVNFLHSIKLTHTDLKPENMLFVDSSFDSFWSENARQNMHVLRNSEIRLIDFGSATFDHEHHSTIVSTRHYRAPEVVLELGWSQPCDLWSCGCIIFELYTGNTLFQTHDNKEHLAMMEHILGPLPSDMIKKSKKTKYFRRGCLDWDVQSAEGKYVQDNCKLLSEYRTSERRLHVELFDLLEKLLCYNPAKRITAEEAVNHPYCASQSHSSSRESR